MDRGENPARHGYTEASGTQRLDALDPVQQTVDGLESAGHAAAQLARYRPDLRGCSQQIALSNPQRLPIARCPAQIVPHPSSSAGASSLVLLLVSWGSSGLAAPDRCDLAALGIFQHIR